MRVFGDFAFSLMAPRLVQCIHKVDEKSYKRPGLRALGDLGRADATGTISSSSHRYVHLKGGRVSESSGDDSAIWSCDRRTFSPKPSYSLRNKLRNLVSHQRSTDHQRVKEKPSTRNDHGAFVVNVSW